MDDLLEKIRASLINNRTKEAFCFEGEKYTYQDFNNQINKIINLLVNEGLDSSKNINIGVVANNDIETYSSLIACWFMGFAYVPLSPNIPIERNKFIVQDADIKWILSSTDDFKEEIQSSLNINYILTSGAFKQIGGGLKIPLFEKHRNAYIIFTSGSTGVPKGVPISQGSLAAFVDNFNSTNYRFEPTDKCLQMFELTFDVSISSFLIPLLHGASVYPVGNKGIRYMQVLKLIQKYQLTNIQIVPSIIRLAGDLLRRLKLTSVKYCIVTGEATSVDLLPELRTCFSNARVFNFYGPTEATIYCSYYQCLHFPSKNYLGLLSIGKSMGSSDLLILNENLVEQMNNEKGELYIGGDQLTKGYLSGSIKNRESFIELPSKQGKIYYKSGDMAYRDDEGDIYYCGRLDNQVKIQGFRIELGEIEYLVRDRFGINCVVIVADGQNNTAELVLVLESTEPVEMGSIKNFLEQRLPSYMIPSVLFLMHEFPLTTSGKTDRKKIVEAFTFGR